MRNEFDHYNTLKLEKRILTAPEVNRASVELLTEKVKNIVKAASYKLRDIQLSRPERMALIRIASEGLKALRLRNKNTLSAFYLDTYPNLVAEGSHKDLSAVNFFDYTVDRKNEVFVHTQGIEDQIRNAGVFSLDVPRREYSMSGIGETIPVVPNFFSTNKEKIFLGVGILALAGLAYHVFKVTKMSTSLTKRSNPHYAKKTNTEKLSKAQKRELKKLWNQFSKEGK